MPAMILGQSSPSATTNTDIYTVPAGKTAICSTLAVCNRSGTVSVSYRIAVRPAGAAIANPHYIAYGVSLPVNSSDYLTIGLALGPTDVVTVWAETSDLSFSLFGNES